MSISHTETTPTTSASAECLQHKDGTADVQESPIREFDFKSSMEMGDKLVVAEASGNQATGHEESPQQPWIGYRTEYRNRMTNNLVAEQVQKKEDRKHVFSRNDGPIFEVITTYKVLAQDLDTNKDQALLALTSQSLPTYALRIHSVALINAIQSVVRYYPGQDLSGEYITIPKPYPVLVHYYEELQDFRKTCLPTPRDELCVRKRDAAEHLRILLEYIDAEVMEGVREERERNARGFSTFDWRWVAHKPGITVVERDERDPGWSAYVVHSIEGGVLDNPPSPWRVKNWALDYDGRFIQRVWNFMTTWPKYDGERKETDGAESTKFLDPTVDSSCLEDEAAQELIQNGKRFLEMLEPKCYQHHGKSAGLPSTQIDGLTMVDIDAYHLTRPEDEPTSMGDEDIRHWTSKCVCEICQQRQEDGLESRRVPLFIDFGSAEKTGTFSDHELLLLPSRVVAYIFRTRSWENVHIRNLTEPHFSENMISHLVMSDSRLKTLKALAKSFARITQHNEPMKDTRWSADFVRGKGNGLIFLLHGKPGVGKTCTAECIAEFTRRPLMILTSSDIGTEPREVEKNLTENFKRAMNWGAVLLIDEADVFMERRSTSDLTRNSLVAGFLRALEFYDGILFLTTNRVGSFDDAFISRIHIQLYYPDFSDDERQKVWKTFIDKLAREKGETMRLTIDAKEYIESTRKQGLKWNGREIRNAFQTAVALAEYEADEDSEGRIMVKDDHLRAVVELSKDFKGYLNDLHRKDEGKRAEQRYERLDSYGSSK